MATTPHAAKGWEDPGPVRELPLHPDLAEAAASGSTSEVEIALGRLHGEAAVDAAKQAAAAALTAERWANLAFLADFLADALPDPDEEPPGAAEDGHVPPGAVEGGHVTLGGCGGAPPAPALKIGSGTCGCGSPLPPEPWYTEGVTGERRGGAPYQRVTGGCDCGCSKSRQAGERSELSAWPTVQRLGSNAKSTATPTRLGGDANPARGIAAYVVPLEPATWV